MFSHLTGTTGVTGPKGPEPVKYIGIIGSGQLGQLLTQETPETTKLPNSITYKDDLQNKQKLIEFGKKCHTITIEIENINIEALHTLKNQHQKNIIPDPSILEMIQNKLTQKQFLINNNFPTSKLIRSYTQTKEHLNPTSHNRQVHKLHTGGYDGRGVFIIKPNQSSPIFDQPVLIEEYIPIAMEVSIVAGRNQEGETILFEPSLLLPNPETQMLDTLICPAPLSNHQIDQINQLTTKLLETLNYVGLLAIEFFITQDDKILINELSPRPHNSGHHTIERYNMSQNEVLRRILTNQSFDQLEIKSPHSNLNNDNSKDYYTMMTNILGKENNPTPQINKTLFYHPDYHLHYYNKTPERPNRKMGHLTYHFSNKQYSLKDLMLIAQRMKASVNLINPEQIKNQPPNNITDVAIIMGSSSDLPVVNEAIKTLNEFNVSYRVKVVSAHRTPQAMLNFAKTAKQNGYQVIIAAAGGAAHLPGMVASATTLPVVGIPVNSSNSIRGIDSLLSINQMPGGIPVATMAINGAKNAALYAMRILALSDPNLEQLLEIYETTLQEKVENQNKLLN